MTTSPIFIVGCPRSGTGLLLKLLIAHPNLFFVGESHFITKFYAAYGDPANRSEALSLASRILQLQWIRRLELSIDPSSLSHHRSFADMVSAIFEEAARKDGRARWVDKTPQYVTGIPTLLRLFPFCKIIHIIRDGRDVALSWLRVPFGPCNVFTAAHEWNKFVSIGINSGKSFPADRYFEIRYESLLAAPETTLKAVCSFIQESYTPALLVPRPPAQKFQPRWSTIGARREREVFDLEIINNNYYKWKTEMTTRDRVIFESVAGDLLGALGYETEGTSRSISKPEEFAWKAHHIVMWYFHQLNRSRKLEWLRTDFHLRWLDTLSRWNRH